MDLIVTEMMQKLGYDQKPYDADEVLAEIADVVPFFKGITRERLGKLGLQWPVKEMEQTRKSYTRKSLS